MKKIKLGIVFGILFALVATGCSSSKRAAKKCGCPYWGNHIEQKHLQKSI